MPACLSGHIDERMEQTKVEQGIDRKLVDSSIKI